MWLTVWCNFGLALFEKIAHGTTAFGPHSFRCRRMHQLGEATKYCFLCIRRLLHLCSRGVHCNCPHARQSRARHAHMLYTHSSTISLVLLYVSIASKANCRRERACLASTTMVNVLMVFSSLRPLENAGITKTQGRALGL